MKNLIYILLGTVLFGAVTTSAAGILYPVQGGTGNGTIPTYGQMLVGNSGGTYTLTATSSLGISSGTTVGTVSTSTTPVLGQLSYWTGLGYPSTLGTVATGTISASGGITATAGQSVIGSGLTIGCTAASAGAAGCLSSADWTTFNGKQAAGNYITALIGDVTASGPGSAAATIVPSVSHWWTATQNFTNASTSQFTATSTIWLTGITSALLSNDANGKVGAYAGSSCTNQFIRSLNGAGAATCATVQNTDLANSSITVTAGTGLSGGGAISLGGSATLNLVTPVTTANGGTGTTTWQTNSLPYFNGTRFTEDNANLSYNGSKLTATNASTTNLSAATSFYAPFASGVVVADSNKLTSGASATTCTNQFVRAMSAAYVATCASVSLTADVTGTLPVANGGTGVATFTTNQLLYGNGTNALSSVATSSLGTASTIVALNANQFTTLPNASTTNLTAGTSLGIPTASNPTPTVAGYVSLSTNSPYQLKIGNGNSGTAVYDPRVAFTFGIATSTTWTGSTTAPTITIPTGVTWSQISCTVQPNGATIDAQYQYANPTAYTTVNATMIPASTTPGIYPLSSNNAPTTNATSTITFGTPAGSPTSASCTLAGTVNGI